MHSRLILPLACLAILVAGCGDEESSSEGSEKKPSNMCETVAPAVPEDWGLTKTSADNSKAKTNCTLADESGKTTLVVTCQKPKSGSGRRRVQEALRLLHRQPAGARRRGVHPDRADQARGVTGAAAARASAWTEPEAVLWVTYQTNDPDVAAEAEDVLDDVEDAVSEN